MIVVSADDRSDTKLQYNEDDTSDVNVEMSQANLEELKKLKQQLERHRRIVAGFRQKIEKEMKNFQQQLKTRASNRGNGAVSSISNSDFYTEIGLFLLFNSHISF